MRILAAFIVFLGLGACSSTVQSLPDLDLMKHGLPIKIKAPENAKVNVQDMGLMKDVTVSADDGFSLQILSSDAISDMPSVKSDRLSEVKRHPFFSKIIEETDAGFIFEKTSPDSSKNYDFRHIRFQGDKQYLFQASMIGKFTEDQVREMWDAVK